MENKKTIRVLQCVNKMDRAGLETFLMNYYRNINRNIVQFDFLTHRDESGAYDDEILKLGGKIYHAPRLMIWNYFKYKKIMKKLFLNNPDYKIVHSHIDTMSYFPLKEAKNNKIKYRISHSHTSKLDLDYKLPIKYYAKLKIKKVANILFACGQAAGKFLYNDKPFKIIHNAIDLDKFKFSYNFRKEIRNKYKIEDNTILIGHIGRLIYIKNQVFLVELLRSLLDDGLDYKLLLIGDGPDKTKIEELISTYKLQDKVILLNGREDIYKYYSAIDVFTMPSLFEGLPLVAVEAQANGLFCVFSDTITTEAKLLKSTIFVGLNDIEKWKREIVNNNKSRTENAYDLLTEKGFNIKEESIKLQDFYLELENRKE